MLSPEIENKFHNKKVPESCRISQTGKLTLSSVTIYVKPKEVRTVHKDQMMNSLPRGNEVDRGQRCPRVNKLPCEQSVALVPRRSVPQGNSLTRFM